MGGSPLLIECYSGSLASGAIKSLCSDRQYINEPGQLGILIGVGQDSARKKLGILLCHLEPLTPLGNECWALNFDSKCFLPTCVPESHCLSKSSFLINQ